MLFIDSTNIIVNAASTKHYNIVHNYLLKYHNDGSPVSDYIITNIKDLILGSPKVLLLKNQEFYDSLVGFSFKEYTYYNNVIKKRKSKMKKLTKTQLVIDAKYETLHKEIARKVNYDNWFSTSDKMYDYQLTENLGRTSCTYCNRTYTHTLKKQKTKSKFTERLLRPQLDHWFPKYKFPLLGLSFCNLIPSCSNCNSSIKGGFEFNLTTHCHPYIDNITDKFEFRYQFDRSVSEYKIFIYSSDKRVSKTFKDLHLKEVYNSHLPELKDLIKTRKAYSKDYLSIIKKTFPKAKLTTGEMYRILFGTEMNTEDYYKRPLSKFKKDILLKLKII